MAGTALGAVKHALVARIRGLAEFANVQVSYGWPGDATDVESVYLGQARSTQEYAGMRTGRRPRNEDLKIDIVIEVHKAGTAEQADADDRAFALALPIEESLATSPVVGPVNFAGVSAVDLVPAVTADGRAALLVLTVDFGARLS